jgi:hypothetical protein
VGPNSTWWSKYREYSDACRRLSWLNTDSKQICDLAILCESTFLPDKSARIFFQHQHDFNYLEIRHLWEDAKTDSKGVHIAGMDYGILVIDSLSDLPSEALPALKILARNGRLIINKNSDYSSLFKEAVIYQTTDDLINAIKKKLVTDIELTSSSEDIRYRHIVKGKDNYYIIFNEGPDEVSSKLEISVNGSRQLINPSTAEAASFGADDLLLFIPHELKIIRVCN